MQIYWQAEWHLQRIDLFRALTVRKIGKPPTTEHCSLRNRRVTFNKAGSLLKIGINFGLMRCSKYQLTKVREREMLNA